MQILTYGTSGMDTLPHDPSMLDQANVEYSYDPSSSHEKEDIDNITVPLARIGSLLNDTVINEAPLQVNFGADKNSGQDVNTAITLSAEAYHAKGDVEYDFTVNGKSIQKSSQSSVVWTPNNEGVYEIAVKVTDSEGNVSVEKKNFAVGTATPEYSIGDVNLDGNVNILDATEIQKHSVELISLNETQLKLADVNHDGKVDILDATEIQKIIVQ